MYRHISEKRGTQNICRVSETGRVNIFFDLKIWLHHVLLLLSVAHYRVIKQVEPQSTNAARFSLVLPFKTNRDDEHASFRFRPALQTSICFRLKTTETPQTC